MIQYNFYKTLTINKFISILIIFLPVCLISGPFLPDLSITLICIFFLYKVIKDKLFYIFKNKYFYYLLFFYIYLVLNGIFNNPNPDTLRVSISYIRFIIFVFAFVYLLKEEINLINNIYSVFLLCFLILIFDGYYQFFTGKNIIGYPLNIIDGKRVSSFFGDELILGSYLSRFFPLFFGLAVYINGKSNKKIFLVSLLFILIEVLIFISGERTAFFYVNLSALFIILLIDKFKYLRIFTFFCSLIFIFFISNYDNSVKERMIDNTLTQMGISNPVQNSKNQKNNKYIFSKAHQNHYESAIKMFYDNSLFGIGVRNFRIYCKEPRYYVSEEGCTTHPHNTYIQLLAEIGIVGFIFIFSIFLYIIFFSFKHIANKIMKKNSLWSDFEICVYACVLISLWPFAPTGNFFNNWLSIIYFYPIAFILWKKI